MFNVIQRHKGSLFESHCEILYRNILVAVRPRRPKVAGSIPANMTSSLNFNEGDTVREYMLETDSYKSESNTNASICDEVEEEMEQK
ncbi:hypothetical protein TNCV_2452791 [Trichonephila clavipes]|nr:hypothetical protein TNCV_2452791 [Trichonephila clavipes]